MAILITGGCGYIGSHTCVEMLAAGYDSDMKLLGTDEVTISPNQENYDYTLPKNSVIRKFFLLTNDGSLSPLSLAEID